MRAEASRLRFNAFEGAYGGAVQRYGQFWNLVGKNPVTQTNNLSQRTGSDDMRISFVPGAPVYRRADAGLARGRVAPFRGFAMPPTPGDKAFATQKINNPLHAINNQTR